MIVPEYSISSDINTSGPLPIGTIVKVIKDNINECGIITEFENNYYEVRVENRPLPAFGTVGLVEDTQTYYSFLRRHDVEVIKLASKLKEIDI